MDAGRDHDGRQGRALRVLLVGGRAERRQQVAQAVRLSGWELVGSVTEPEDAVRLTRCSQPEVVLLDVRVLGGGPALVRRLRRELPGVAVLLAGPARAATEVVELLDSGACGYLSVQSPGAVARALQAAAQGELVLPRDVVRTLLTELQSRVSSTAPTSGPLSRLTAREWSVVRLLRQGLGTGEVALELGIEPVTVRSYVAAAKRKLGSDDREGVLTHVRDLLLA